MSYTYISTIGMFFSVELREWFIFPFFVFSLERKKKKMECARNSAKKNRSNTFKFHKIQWETSNTMFIQHEIEFLRIAFLNIKIYII